MAMASKKTEKSHTEPVKSQKSLASRNFRDYPVPPTFLYFSFKISFSLILLRKIFLFSINIHPFVSNLYLAKSHQKRKEN